MLNEIIINSQVKLSAAQRQQNFIAKLKETGKFDESKKNKAEQRKQSRLAMQTKENEMPIARKSKIIAKRRKQNATDAKNYRQRKKLKKKQNETAALIAPGIYNNVQTLGKAVKKASKGLPDSPKKKRVVLAKMVTKLDVMIVLSW